ncbi:MAG TPA: hypothetical protein VMW35_01070 [Myxococcota bacterium]|jgi:hypothetical protein|nr:hypothetical protein [Myxococcota bacterium]
MDRSPALRWLAVAALALGVQTSAPAARADEAAKPAADQAGAMCPAEQQRNAVSGTPAMLERLRQRIEQESGGGNTVVLSNSGYSYGSSQPGVEAALLEFEAEQQDHAPAR